MHSLFHLLSFFLSLFLLLARLHSLSFTRFHSLVRARSSFSVSFILSLVILLSSSFFPVLSLSLSHSVSHCLHLRFYHSQSLTFAFAGNGHIGCTVHFSLRNTRYDHKHKVQSISPVIIEKW